MARTVVERGRTSVPIRLLPGLRPGRMTGGVGVGLRFEAGPSDSCYETGAAEMPVQMLLESVLRCGFTFYDVGANVGYFTVIAARLVGSTGHVVAFEPVAANLRFIRLNAGINRLKNIVVRQEAVSDQDGEAELLVAEYSGGSALATADQQAADVIARIAVRTITLDHAVYTEGLPPPDAVKIDVEGAELQVLRGMVRLLREHRPQVLYEIDDLDEAAYQRKQRACDAFLEDLGYSLTRLAPSYPGARSIVGHTFASCSTSAG